LVSEKTQILKNLLEITKDSVGGVPSNLVLGGNTDQALHKSENNIGRSDPVTLIIHYYLYSFIFPHCHAWIRCSQIDPNCRAPLLACWPLSSGTTSSKTPFF